MRRHRLIGLVLTCVVGCMVASVGACVLRTETIEGPEGSEGPQGPASPSFAGTAVPDAEMTFTDTTWNDLSQTLHLPSAGTYLIWYNVLGTYQRDSARPDGTRARLVWSSGETPEAAIAGQQGTSVQAAGNLTIIAQVTTTGPDIVAAQACNNISGDGFLEVYHASFAYLKTK